MNPIKIEDTVTGNFQWVREVAGRLTCDCETFAKVRPGRAASCSHVKQAILKERDARDEDGQLVPLAANVLVLIFEQPKLEVAIRLPREDEYDIRQVLMPLNREGRTVPPIHIGFIGPGQGRMSIRRQLLEWVVAASYDRPTCTARQHYKYSDELLREAAHTWPSGRPADTQLERCRQIDTFDLHITGQCRVCNEDSGIPDV